MITTHVNTFSIHDFEDAYHPIEGHHLTGGVYLYKGNVPWYQDEGGMGIFVHRTGNVYARFLGKVKLRFISYI
jgi:hypothetical protein